MKKRTSNDYPVFIIAEMAWAHDGSLKKAKKIIKGAANAGANAISLHITNMEDYMVKDYGCSAGQTVSIGKEKLNIYKYLEKINLKDKEWKELISYAKGLGLTICVMPNDFKSLSLCKKIKPDMYVIAAACFVEEDFVIEIAKEKKPVILRIGGATLAEIKKVVSLVKKHGSKKIILLPGIQLYPTKTEDTNLNLIPTLIKTFKLPVGVADHIDAESELALIVPLLAIPLGAVVIEKHITHDRSLKGEDIEAALNPDEFKKFVGYVREAEKSLGKSRFGKLSEGELKYRNVSRKRTVAAEEIKKNEKITKNKIIFKRADKGIYPNESKFLIGRFAKKNIQKDEPISFDKIL